MQALDTNVLVAAHREDAEHHAVCLALLQKWAERAQPYGLFWPSLYEFLRVVTHHRVFNPPTPNALALQAVADFIQLPGAIVLAEGVEHGAMLRRVLEESKVTGNLVHDAHLVALALEHGVHEIITFDQDFSRFRQIAHRSPLEIANS